RAAVDGRLRPEGIGRDERGRNEREHHHPRHEQTPPATPPRERLGLGGFGREERCPTITGRRSQGRGERRGDRRLLAGDRGRALLWVQHGYSLLSASIGARRAARDAGYTPNATPMPMATTIAARAAGTDMMTRESLNSGMRTAPSKPKS